MCVDGFSFQINEAANVIYENVDPAANIIFGALVDPEAKSELPDRLACGVRCSL